MIDEQLSCSLTSAHYVAFINRSAGVMLSVPRHFILKGCEFDEGLFNV